MMKSIFICYSSDDRRFAQRLAQRLESFYDVFLDFSGIAGGQAWEREIESAIKQSAVFLVVVTPQSNDSEWCARETILAENLNKPRVPVLVSGSMPLRLLDLQYVDFRGDFDGAFADLLESIGGHARPELGSRQDADQLLGAAIRARAIGETARSDSLLKQAMAVDAELAKIGDEIRQMFSEPESEVSLASLNELFAVESASLLPAGKYDDQDGYKWSVALQGDPDTLDQVDHVEYVLHPTFSPRTQIVRSREDGFRLEKVGWGIFELILRLQLKDGRIAEASYGLTFKNTNRQQLRWLARDETEPGLR